MYSFGLFSAFLLHSKLQQENVSQFQFVKLWTFHAVVGFIRICNARSGGSHSREESRESCPQALGVRK